MLPVHYLLTVLAALCGIAGAMLMVARILTRSRLQLVGGAVTVLGVGRYHRTLGPPPSEPVLRQLLREQYDSLAGSFVLAMSFLFQLLGAVFQIPPVPMVSWWVAVIALVVVGGVIVLAAFVAAQLATRNVPIILRAWRKPTAKPTPPSE
jgi:MFS family permease